ncbi:glycine receptor subunit alpha-4-like isoform X1 [Mya arenaria]|uniref:glycine receptor subunit alpha-4-like isoform X1 n=1 Tax=Mya arenaria TaxID=6604 RepID=UPI0022E51B29|nr:glycine receptor subunit alpha-4-like isoform X1 [Mya arenaria]
MCSLRWCGVAFVLVGIVVQGSEGQNSTLNDTDIPSTRKLLIENLFLRYDARIPPTTSKEGSTNVTVQLFILSIDSISETNMDFSISMFLRQRWFDKRLMYTPRADMVRLEMDSASIARVWVPDLFMPAEKSAHVHHVTVPNKLMHIYPDGTIQYSLRMSATIKCNFDLRKFPLDSQHCMVEMESYGYTTDTMRFEWAGLDPISHSPGLAISQFTLNEISTSQCDKLYYGVGYSCVRFDISMVRSKGYYITQVIIPSYLIVFLSWVSFWLDIDAVPARISLGLLTVLTMTTQSAGARNNLPKVSYLKAIDVWMAACLLFVFLALVQFAYVNVLSRVQKRRQLKPVAGKIALGTPMSADDSIPPNEDIEANNTTEDKGARLFGVVRRAQLQPVVSKIAIGTPLPVDNSLPHNGDVEANGKMDDKGARIYGMVRRAQMRFGRLVSADREKARNIDRISRTLFPVAFFLFNLVYWCVYIFWEPVTPAE